MKIAITTPFYYRLTKKSDGGIETFLYDLVASLVDRGHDVTSFTVGDSELPGEIISIFDEPTDSVSQDPYIRQSREIAGSVKTFRLLKEMTNQFDVIHNNQINFYAHLTAREVPNCITTLHSPPDYYPILQAKSIDPLALTERVVAISDYQRQVSSHGFIGRVYNGIDINQYQFTTQPSGDYIAWMGRFIPQKGVQDALEAATQAQAKLQLAGTPWGEEFFNSIMSQVEANPNFKYIGHADTATKNQLLGNARALIFPSHFHEFGYVRTEALACGTPVITYDAGAARELVIDGVTGFVCPLGDTAALAEAVKKIMTMPEEQYQQMRQACRDHAVANFSLEAMVAGYETLYQQVAKPVL